MAATESFYPSTTHKLVANESAFQKTRPTTGAISLAGQNWQNWLTCLFFPSTIFEILWFTVESPVYALHTARNSNVDSNAPLLDLPEKKSGYAFGYNETLILISLYQKYETLSVIFPSRKRQFGNWLPRTWKKNGLNTCGTSQLNRIFTEMSQYAPK